VKFTIRNSKEKEEEEASFNLLTYTKRDAKETDAISGQYIIFATNMRYSEARRLYRKIPLEYKNARASSWFQCAEHCQGNEDNPELQHTIRIVYHDAFSDDEL
jgi:hypothetical protein